MSRPKPTVESLFALPGYVRVPREERAVEGSRIYKKGWEVRLVADDCNEARRIAALAERLGYRPGAAFVKGRQYIVPIYGLTAVEAFRAVRARLSASGEAVRASHHDLVDLAQRRPTPPQDL